MTARLTPTSRTILVAILEALNRFKCTILLREVGCPCHELARGTEDESGYLKLVPPTGGWKPGKYKEEIHVGEQISDVRLVGTMRFTVVPDRASSTARTR